MPGGRVRPRCPRALAVALATAALAALAGCTGEQAGTASGGAPAPSTASTASTTDATTATTAAATSTTAAASYRARVLAWGRQLAQCARAHGQPNFPDPRFMSGDDPGLGTAEFPGVDKLAIARAEDACLAIVRQMPPRQPTRPPSAATMRQMRRFSQCMRQHGVAAFPDPRANGTFPILGTPLRVFAPGYIQDLPPAYESAWDACFSLQTNWRMLAS
jgi:hypothetical protein